MMKKRGFTLMELLVYMAIVGIVVVIAGQVFSDSTKMRVRTQSMMKASELAENAGTLLSEDLAQMGAKSYLDGTDYAIDENVYIDPSNSDANLVDYSSFVYTKGNANDAITFRKITNKEDGSFLSVESVSWYVENSTLYRSCKTLKLATSATADESCPTSKALAVAIVDGVDEFKILPAKPIVLSSAVTTTNSLQLFPSGNADNFRLLSRVDGTDFFRALISPEEGGASVAISGFTSNYDMDNEEYTTDRKANQLYAASANGNIGNWNDLCTKVTLDSGITYELSFTLPRTGTSDKSQSFIPGIDYMSVGFRSTSGEKYTQIPDFNFYPSTASAANSITREAFFSVSSKVQNACIAFTFAAYSPLFASGTISIGQLKLKKVTDLNFQFVDDYNPEVADKVNVRAFKFSLTVKKNGEAGVSSHVVAVTSNGVGAN